MIFVMKFQAAAMGRADMPADQREDFCLYVDEFQNFATDSFESILSEARKYKLNLVLANQFMTQLTDKIREAIIGNVGTVISGRIGITDAEILQKKFSPTFDAEDLTKLPNFQTVASVMINNVPSAPFSMSLIPPMGKSNPQLRDALKRLSAAKYGRPRAQVEKEIFARLGAGDAAKREKMEAMKLAQQQRMSGGATQPKQAGAGSSFLDDWLAKRQQMGGTKPAGQVSQASVQRPLTPSGQSVPPFGSQAQQPHPTLDPKEPFTAPVAPSAPTLDQAPQSNELASQATPDKLHLRGEEASHHDEISIKLR
jgi:hypothetical protein